METKRASQRKMGPHSQSVKFNVTSASVAMRLKLRSSSLRRASTVSRAHAHSPFLEGLWHKKIADLVVFGNFAPSSETNWLCARLSFLRARESR
jgi:hypothetical protein